MATPIDVVVFKCRKICPTENRWNRALFSGKKQNFGCLSSCRCAWTPFCPVECFHYSPEAMLRFGRIKSNIMTRYSYTTYDTFYRYFCKWNLSEERSGDVTDRYHLA